MWISPQEVAMGVNGLPPIPVKTQNTLRSKRKIKYAKIGRRVVYKLEWIEDYINNNIREPRAD